MTRRIYLFRDAMHSLACPGEEETYIDFGNSKTPTNNSWRFHISARMQEKPFYAYRLVCMNGSEAQ